MAGGALLRDRDGGQARVGFVELFFDLVFVFAVTRLSHALIEHPTALGLVQVGLLLMAVWWAWMYTAWATNWLEVDHALVRGVLFALMAAGIVMASSLSRAFGEGGLIFALSYVMIQAGRTAFVVWCVRGDAVMRRNFLRILAWFAASAVLWVAGALTGGGARLALWLLALGLEYAGPAAAFWTPGLGRSSTRDWTIDGAHMAERCGLFVIIALGESILVTGMSFAEAAWTPSVILAFAAAFATAVAMWWIYFSAGAEAASREIARSDDPGRIGRLAYTYVHILLVAGIIVTAVGDEWTLAHPDGRADVRTAMAVLGGPALFLLGGLAFKGAVWRRWSFSRLAGLGLLAALAPLAPHVNPVALSWLATGALLGVAVWETRTYGLNPAR